MRVAILRREPQFSFSMDVYANGVANGLRKVRPDWEILELMPEIPSSANSLIKGLQRYYHRYWHYPQSLGKQQVDVFHIIDHSDAHMVYWLQKSGKSHVVTCHDLINLVRPETFRGKARFPLISMATWKWAISGLEKADRIISVSQHTARDITNCLKVAESEIEVIPNAVDRSFHRLDAAEVIAFKQQHNLVDGKDFYLLNVGSNNSRKNVMTVLEVLAELKNRGLNVHLWRVGANFDETQQAFIKDRNLEQSLTSWGKPDDKTLIKLYNAADVLIAPSLYEGFGMTILEAMACGTPVITSNVTSLPEVAGDAAVLCDPKDVATMADAIANLIKNSGYRQSLITKGLERVKQFSWEVTAEKVARVYEQLCQSKKL